MENQVKIEDVENSDDVGMLLDSMGQFGSKLGHDFNNILGSIQGCVDLIRAKIDRLFPDGNPCEKQFKLIESSLKKGTAITSKIRGYVRPGESEVNRIALGQLIDAVIGVLVVTGVSRSEVEVICDAKSQIRGNEMQLSQLLLSLCVNAMDAMSKRSERTLLIVASEKEIREGDLGIPPGLYVRVSVADHGGGFSMQVRDRLFEPFLSTKRSRVGDGYGLSLVMGKEIMRRHSGAIEVRTEPDVGTVVHLYFPAVAN